MNSKLERLVLQSSLRRSAANCVPTTLARIFANAVSRPVEASSAKGEKPPAVLETVAVVLLVLYDAIKCHKFTRNYLSRLFTAY